MEAHSPCWKCDRRHRQNLRRPNPWEDLGFGEDLVHPNPPDPPEDPNPPIKSDVREMDGVSGVGASEVAAVGQAPEVAGSGSGEGRARQGSRVRLWERMVGSGVCEGDIGVGEAGGVDGAGGAD